jgi:hypothetical protein
MEQKADIDLNTTAGRSTGKPKETCDQLTTSVTDFSSYKLSLMG